MKKTIVITSIFSPTKAVQKFAQLKDYNLIVAGDKKTPQNWSHPQGGVEYLSVDEQNTMEGQLAKSLPFNHYCRKMCGYVHGIRNGADIIIDTDDDNIPYDDWDFPEYNGEKDVIADDLGFINVYQLYSKQKIWPRGLPLRLIGHDFELADKITPRDCKVGIWQGLADGDPDVDAIYRLTSDEECVFNKRDALALGKGTISPFNSQNTAIIKELFPLLYMPVYVTFRFTDILRGLVAQPIMWLLDYHLGFTSATVFQERNPHNYMDDFASEIPMYLQGEKVVDIVAQAINANMGLNDNLFNAYVALEKEGIVEKRELDTLSAWLKDIEV